MDILDNPFTPSFGRTPPYLAGRKMLLQDLARAFEGNGNDPLLQSVFVGARGSGKTTMLTLAADLASARGWVAASVSCAPGMLEDILQRTMAAGAEFIEQATGHTRLKGLSIGQIVSAEWEYARQADANWRTLMTNALEELADRGVGLLITVDEVRTRQEEMIQLATIFQHFIRENRRVSLLMAGLPHHISQLVDDDAVSFLRRASRITLGRIEDFEIRDALRRTVEEGGKRIDDDAVDLCVAAIDGFPYMMQLVGFRTWDASGREETISGEHAERGVDAASHDMLQQILVPTWASLSAGDKAFCLALADGNSTAREIARELSKKPNYVSKYKQRLLEQGVIEQDPYERLHFCLPGFEDFVRNAPAD